MAMNDPAQLVAARKEESSVVAQSTPASANAHSDHNISEKLVSDELRKEIEEEVRKKVEEEVRKLVQECRVGAGLVLLSGMFARWNAGAVMSQMPGAES
jgi:hypothetical protein